MCQISVVIAGADGEERLMDNVTGLKVTKKGVVLTAFFEEPKEVADVVIARIDFLGGKVFLARRGSQTHPQADNREQEHG
jgi:predicted RNA-binding protein